LMTVSTVSKISHSSGFHDAPTPFDRIICAVIGRIKGQFDRELIRLGKGQEPIEKLSVMALILGSIIQVDHQRPHVLKAFSHTLPPLFPHIYQAISDDFGGHTGQKEFIGQGNQDAYRDHPGGRLAHRGLQRGQSPLMRSGMPQASSDCLVALGYPPDEGACSPASLGDA
jgi:hypothetical protein